MRRAAAFALPLAIVFAVSVWRSQGIAPRGADAPPERFSSARALAVLRDLVREQVPHPVGTPANAVVRDRITARFRVLGYETSVQRRFACNAAAMCATVENVIAKRPGARGKSVLLVAHYDSVGAGSGTTDDAMGTAALLEIARALQKESLRNPVTFLVTDGEEAGLLGAEAFVADETLLREAGVVVNVENRGTYGASNMFETSQGNRWLVRHLAGALPNPRATSFFYEIYNLLPNDTDVTVFKREGVAAVNFAAVSGVSWYHTPFDDLAHASPRTLQHHGDNLLATARVLAEADLDARSSADATYFDLLGFTLVWWPQRWTVWIAVLSLLLLVAAARKMPPREMTFGVLTAFAAILLSVLLGLGASWLARLRSQGIDWVAHPVAPIAAMWLAGLTAALFAAALFRRKAAPLPMLYGIAIVWHTIGIALAFRLGGAAFLFIVPAAAVTVCALARAKELVTGIAAATVAAILMFPLGLMLYEALGGRLMVVVAILIGTLATFAAPLFASWRSVAAAAIATLLLAGLALVREPFDDAKPQRINVAYVDDAAASSPQWIVNQLPERLRAAATFGKYDASITPWNPASSFAAAAPSMGLARPVVTQEPIAGGVRVRARSQRGANRITLIFRDGTVQRVNGIPLPPRPSRFRDRSGDAWKYASASGVDELVVDIATPGLASLIASDMTYGLPPSGAPLQKARDASRAFASQDGDVTVVRTRVK